MDTNYIETNGSVKISEDVIATIVGVTVRESANIAGLTVRTMTDIKGLIPSKKSATKGVKVEIDEGKISIEVGIIVNFGVKLQEAALKLQNDIIKEIEAMTGMKVKSVNVYIQGMAEKPVGKATGKPTERSAEIPEEMLVMIPEETTEE